MKINRSKFSFEKLKKNDYFALTGIFSFILVVMLFVFFSGNYNDREEPTVLDIPKGTGFSQVVDTLYELKIIPNKTNFRIAAFLCGAETRIKAGRYQIPDGLSYISLVSLLLKGQPEEQELVTIPEGIWQKNLAGLLQSEIGVDSAEFMKLSTNRSFIKSLDVNANTIEGYLLPETYFLYLNCEAEEVIEKLKNEMDKLFDDSANERMDELGMTEHQILTLASIIDGETNIVSEYKRISGVYHNRLKKGIKLQADPTIQYLKRDGKHNKIYFKDLEIDSRYNTYMYSGLPPGPINNPGKDAIYAALYPEEHNYYFFVADGKGGHLFAKTLSEHNRNVAKYRLWRNKNQ